MCKMCNLKTELANLNHTVENNTLVDMLLESLPDQIEFERLKSSIYYDADPSIYTAARVRKLILAASTASQCTIPSSSSYAASSGFSSWTMTISCRSENAFSGSFDIVRNMRSMDVISKTHNTTIGQFRRFQIQLHASRYLKSQDGVVNLRTALNMIKIEYQQNEY